MTDDISAGISFYTEDIEFDDYNEGKISDWLNKVSKSEGSAIKFLNIIFCSDNYLHQLNVQYLNHDTLTDVITFPYDEGEEISGDIFISTERVLENSRHLGVSFKDELHRVMVHGLLHLLGYGDKTEEEEKEMREKEDFYLGLRN